MKHFVQHIRNAIFRGLFAVIPISLSVVAVYLLYTLIDKRVMAFLEKFVEVRQVPGLGILLVLVCLYLMGLFVSNVIGRQLFRLLEGITQRIPLVKAIYQIGKQLSEGLSVAEEKQGFKKVVLVDWNNNGTWGIGFVAGPININGEAMLRVFIPKVPNPATGFIFIVKESKTIDPGWTVEEGIKMVVSAAIISPKEIKKAL